MTKTQQFSDKVIGLWNSWEIRGMVLLSLTLQTVLIIFGSQRKYIAKTWIRIPVWSAYLLADLVATVALGNLARSHGDCGDTSAKPNNLIQVFWAPFLLLHLGGPDTITAYSVEDNELWLRHLLNLVIQVGVASYVLLKSWVNNTLMLLAILVFIAAIIKYGERNWVLRSSTSQCIRDSLRSVVSVQKRPTGEVMVVPRELNVPVMTYYLDEAYYLFKMSKYLFQDLVLGLTELKDSYLIISKKRSSEEAFKLVEVELGLMYDMLYTKAPIVYSYLGIFLRSISCLCTITALIVFSIVVNKHDYALADTGITYLLLAGATALEVYAFFLLIFSDRTMIWLTKFKYRPSKSMCDAISTLHMPLSIGKRWSRSMGQHSLINSCLNSYLVKCANLFGGIDDLVKHMHINWKDVDLELLDIIFKQLLEKSKDLPWNPNYDNLRNQLLAERGDAVLDRWNLSCLLWSINGVEFNQSLLIWHIATNFCYYSDTEEERNNNPRRKLSKCLSDYMCYLLAARPNMLPKGIGDVAYSYQDTRIDIMQLCKKLEGKCTEKQACNGLFELQGFYGKLNAPKAKESAKSALYYGTKLAYEMQPLLTEEGWWEMISEVWIEMLGYAASQCEWKEHAQQLRRGGELLTHVALLMAHLGLSRQYQEIRGDPIREMGAMLAVEIMPRLSTYPLSGYEIALAAAFSEMESA